MSRLRSLSPFIAFGTALLAVQGSIYVLQIAAAASVDASAFSEIRTIESLAAVLALAISFGLPSTLLVQARKSLRQDTLRLTGSASLTALVFFAIAATSVALAMAAVGLIPDDFVQMLVFALPLGFMMAARLVYSAGCQAQQRFGALSVAAIVASSASVGLFGLAIYIDRADTWTWLASRFILEILVVVGLWRISFGPLGMTFRPLAETLSRTRLLQQSALPLGASLFIRSLIDQGPILLAAAITVPAVVAGEVGLAITVCTIALVPAATAQGVIVPRLVETAVAQGAVPYRSLAAYIAIGALVSASAGCAFFALLPMIIDWIGPPSVDTLLLLAAVIAAKMSASAIGGALLALQRNATILRVNTLTACAGLIAALTLVSLPTEPTVQSFLIALALVESLGAGMYCLALFRRWRNGGNALPKQGRRA